MENYCSNCGKKLNKNQDVCLNCGKNIKKGLINLDAYKKISGIINIILGFIIDISAEEEWNDPSVMQGIGFVAIIAGILVLCSKKEKWLSIVSGILLIVSSIGLIMLYEDISIASIALLIFGIFNIALSDK